ncbi:DUF2853 family protein [Parvularcula maris]|uniref:DUF2853 family protein n=1 Tax=Parvularcula maris TaxID=2965077 RepID=A0A9X2RKZ7_9PROT|nr:DUF2853 family protein [Parvularcula maris]MCQ8186303.1 DUF2853 family protein [Parvularcula maris]
MADHQEHLDKIRSYDSGADEEVVKKLWSRLRLSMQNRDAQTVACSDKAELEHIRDGYCKKTLDLGDKHSDEEIMGVLQNVCQTMSGDGGRKSRMTFYYLVAKETGTLEKI